MLDGKVVLSLNLKVIHVKLVQSCFGTSASLYQALDARYFAIVFICVFVFQ